MRWCSTFLCEAKQGAKSLEFALIVVWIPTECPINGFLEQAAERLPFRAQFTDFHTYGIRIEPCFNISDSIAARTPAKHSMVIYDFTAMQLVS